MATAWDPDSEGKTLAASEICGACKTYVAEKLCEECPVTLCVTCARAHQNLKFTADHALIDIRKPDDSVSSSKPASSVGQCPLHKQQHYTTLCKDCIQLACDLCKPDHTGHSLQLLNGDHKLCQRVCSKHIQHLLDDLHEFEELKSVLENNIETYDEAVVVVDKWELELIPMVRDKTAKLRERIKYLKNKKVYQLSDKLNGLANKLTEIDNSISKLNTIRKSMDFDILTNELSASQYLINKLEACKLALQPVPKVFGVHDVLPQGGKMQDIGKDLDALLLLTEIYFVEIGLKPVAAWKFSANNNGKDLSVFGGNPVTMTNIQYGPGPNGEVNGAAILPTGNQSMIVKSPTRKLIFSTEMTFFIHIYIKKSNNGPLFEYEGSRTSFLVASDSKSISFRNKSQTIKAPNVLALNDWNKIAVVYKAQSISMYVDGKLVKAAKLSFDSSDTLQKDILFGKYGSYTIEGRVACAYFFDLALTDQEIKSLK